MSSLTFEWRRGIRYALIALWFAVFVSQIVLYTTLVEIIGYLLLGSVVFFFFLKFWKLFQSPYSLLGAILTASFVLGLVPYRIRLDGLRLFFFQAAKDANVTYFVDPYLNMSGLFIYLIFPVAHFVLMFAITKTYLNQPD